MSNGWDDMATVGRVAGPTATAATSSSIRKPIFRCGGFKSGGSSMRGERAASSRSRLTRSGSTAAARSLAFEA